MSAADVVQVHQERCAPQLARLQWLARREVIAERGSSVAGLVAEATSTVLAEAKAAERAALAPNDSGASDSSLLRSRLTRLEKSARGAVAAARDGDPVVLRQELARFETFTAAMWTVQLSVCGHEQ